MNLNNVTPAHDGAGQAAAMLAFDGRASAKPDKFERLAVNLSKDEIRSMVMELMG